VKIINQHLGLPVISLDTSERAGDVIRFITDQVSGRVVAVAVSRKWYQEPHGVPFEDCRAFGQNVVLISRLDALRPLSQMEEVGLHLEASNDARQRTAITEGGKLLGSVTDEAFDEETGEVSGYRLDVIADTGTSRTVYIPRDTFVTSSGTVAILREDVLEHGRGTLEELAGGQGPELGDGSREPGAGGREPEQGPGAGVHEPERESERESEREPESRTDAQPGAWPGAEVAAFAPPVEATEPAGPVEPEASGDDDEALFEDMTPADEVGMVEAEEFPPVVPDYEPASEAPPEAAPEPEAASRTVQPEALPGPAPAEAPPVLHGHDRVMMALSLGQVAQSTVRDPLGAVIVEAGQTVTDEVTHAAARAGADTLYALWKATQEPDAA